MYAARIHVPRSRPPRSRPTKGPRPPESAERPAKPIPPIEELLALCATEDVEAIAPAGKPASATVRCPEPVEAAARRFGARPSGAIDVIDRSAEAGAPAAGPGDGGAGSSERASVSRGGREVRSLREMLGRPDVDITLTQRAFDRVRATSASGTPSIAPGSGDRARARFLRDTVRGALATGWRSAGDLARFFPPRDLMQALDGHPAVRAPFLRLLIGVRPNTALRVSAADAATLLEAGLEAGDYDAEAYARVVERTAACTYVDAKCVWEFTGLVRSRARSSGVAEVESRKERVAEARKFVAHVLERTLAHGLVTASHVVHGIGIEVFAERLPRMALGRIIGQALEDGRRGRTMTEADVLGCVPLESIVAHVPLDHVIDEVIDPLARARGLRARDADEDDDDADASERVPSSRAALARGRSGVDAPDSTRLHAAGAAEPRSSRPLN